jgi:DNA-binding Lrp family transcriptional regulator
MNVILEILRADARANAARIADMTGLQVDAVAEQIAQWENAGVIRGYRVVIDADKLRHSGEADEEVSALIDVSVTPARGLGFDDVAERIARFTEVRAVYLISGAHDLRCHVVGRSMHDVADFVAQKLSSLDRVTATATYFVLKTYKESGDLFVEREIDQRLPVVP